MTHFDRSLTLRPARPQRPEAIPEGPPRRVDSETLLQGARRLIIAHGSDVYTLRLTRQNKLLLTK